MRNSKIAIQQLGTRADCLLYDHAYHATWTPSSFVCTRCGKQAMCSGCVLQWPDTPLALHLCQRKEDAHVS